MRHKKKRYLPRKCGPPRSKSYCATRRNATKRGQFCHFGLFAGQLVGSPPHKLPKMVRFPKLPYKEFNSAGTASILEFLAFSGLSSRLLLATSKERFLMRHKKKRYLSRKCGPPRSKSYCATRRNATKRGQFCHFGLFAGQLVGSPPTSCQKWSVFSTSHTKNLSAPGPPPFWNF